MDYAADWNALPGGRAAPSPGNMRVSVADQVGRDQTRLRILQDESKDPANAGDTALQRELEREQAKQGIKTPDYAADWEALPATTAKAQNAPVEAPGASGAVSNKQPKTVAGKAYDLAKGAIGFGAITGDNPVAEAGKTLATGAAGAAAGGLVGLYKLATTGGDTQAAADAVEATKAAFTHQPEGTTAQAIVKGISSNWNPLNWPYAAGSAIADYGSEKGLLSPAEATAIKTGSMLVTPAMILKGLGIVGKATEVAPAAFGSVGSSAATREASIAADLSGASPELQAAAKNVRDINPEAMARHVQADSLPVPVKLTAGQASLDPIQITFERNNRGKLPGMVERLNEQSPQLHENLTAIRDKVAPDVYSVLPSENSSLIIKGYQTKDAAIRADISSKYKALETAAGGEFPIDGKAFVASADKALAKALKTDYVPAPIAKLMNRFREGEPMNFEQFEAMRTNLASDIRSSADGNVRHAAGIVRDALESLPLAPEAATLKPLADAARSAAKARFDLLKKDPAYQAAVNDVAPDKFISKYVIAAPARDVATMVKNLGAGTPEHQAMAAGVINYLKQQAGTEANNFSQAGYNKALNGLAEKLPQITGQEAAKQLRDVGEVARNTVFQPRGSYVNNSNTFTAALAEHAKGFAEGAANKVLGMGIVPIGSMIRGVAAKSAANKAALRSLQTGAGISLKDIGKTK